METHTTAVKNIGADVSHTLIGEMTIANGDALRTGEFFTQIAHAIAEMERVLGTVGFTVDLRFGPHGVTVRGTTK